MKSLVILSLALIVSFNSFAKKYIVITGKAKHDIDYYYDSDIESKTTIKVTNGIYELKIPKKTKYNKVTFMETRDEWCKQELTISNLKEYSKSTKTDTVINDVTYLNSCETFEVDENGIPSDFIKFIGKWENENVKIRIFANESFFLTYTENNIEYTREGVCRYRGNLILLRTSFIRNNFTRTLSDNSELISYSYKENMRLSDTDGVELNKIK